jgi:Arc/MetJ-type ribon-helix-helix transcriptional regulator
LAITLKTLRISDDAHQKLTRLLGEITAQTMKMQTYTEAIENLLSQSVTLPPELLNEIQGFVESNRQLGYTTREEFVRDAILFQLRSLREQYEYMEVSKDDFERVRQALQDLDTPFESVDEFVHGQLHELLEKHEAWIESKRKYEKG